MLNYVMCKLLLMTFHSVFLSMIQLISSLLFGISALRSGVHKAGKTTKYH